jgi:hypothetical protein
MKALTLYQPWGTAMRHALKAAETRSWGTPYRGLLAIHAGKKLDKDYLAMLPAELRGDVPTGVVLGVVDLLLVERMTAGVVEKVEASLPTEYAWGNWQVGRYAWWTKPVVWFREPIPARGSLGLWDWQEPADWRDRGAP